MIHTVVVCRSKFSQLKGRYHSCHPISLQSIRYRQQSTRKTRVNPMFLVHNQRKFFDELAIKLKVTNPEDWYRVKKWEITANGGSYIMNTCYNNMYDALRHVYPDVAWQPWRFGGLPRDFWTYPEHQELMLEHLAETLGITCPDHWKHAILPRIIHEGGQAFMKSFRDSIAEPLKTTYPEYEWTHFPPPPPTLPIWMISSDKENFRNLAKTLNITDLDQWYNVSEQLVGSISGRIQHKYNNSLMHALMTVFPQHPWKIYKFNNTVSAAEHWKDVRNQKTFLEETARKFFLGSTDEWRTISAEGFKHQGGETLLQYHGGGPDAMMRMLQAAFPHHSWNFERVTPLTTVLKELFAPHVSMRSNYSHPSLKLKDGNESFQIDVYIPDYKLGILWGGTKEDATRKQEVAKESNIALAYIPEETPLNRNEIATILWPYKKELRHLLRFVHATSASGSSIGETPTFSGGERPSVTKKQDNEEDNDDDNDNFLDDNEKNGQLENRTSSENVQTVKESIFKMPVLPVGELPIADNKASNEAEVEDSDEMDEDEASIIEKRIDAHRPVMLASEFAGILSHPSTWWMTEKFDGIRIVWDGKEKYFVTRHGGVIIPPPEIVSAMPDDIELDGELWYCNLSIIRITRTRAGRGYDYTRTLHLLKRKLWSQLIFAVFDSPTMGEAKLEDRVREIQRIAQICNHKLQHLEGQSLKIMAVPFYQCKSKDQLYQFLTDIVKQEGEGVVLRKKASKYERKRSKFMMKLKIYTFEYALVLEYSQYSHVAKCKFKDNMEFNVHIRHGRIAPGNVVVVKYLKRAGPKGNPRELKYQASTLRTWEDVLADFMPLTKRVGSEVYDEELFIEQLAQNTQQTYDRLV